jgi:hypothetical protein
VLGDANPAIPIGSLAGRAYAFCINAPAKEGSLVWQAVIRLTGDPAKPYWLLEWDRRPCDAA